MALATRLLTFGLLAAIAGCDQDKIRRLQKENERLAKENRDLPATLDAATNVAKRVREKACVDQASAMFKAKAWGQQTSYTPHYQQKLNKCFVRIQNLSVDNKGSIKTIRIWDSFRHEYASYFEAEPQPTRCRVVFPSGEEKFCQSEDEFDKLVKVYMEE